MGSGPSRPGIEELEGRCPPIPDIEKVDIGGHDKVEETGCCSRSKERGVKKESRCSSCCGSRSLDIEVPPADEELGGCSGCCVKCGESCCCGKCGSCCKCSSCCAALSCLPISACCRCSKCCKKTSNIETTSDIESPERNYNGRKNKLGSFDSDNQVTRQEDVVHTKREKCVSCCKKFIAFLFSTIGLCTVMVAYTIFGGFIFMKLEAPHEIQQKNTIKGARKFYAKMLWNLTDELNVIYPLNWTELAEKILFTYSMEVYEATKKHGWDGNDEESEIQWTLPGAMLYSITVITTIGYGHIAPRTDWGRVVTILYAIFGIPLTLLTLTNLGGFMATAFRFIYKNICCGLCCLCCQKPDKVRTAAVKYKDNGDPGASKSLTQEVDPGEKPPGKYPMRVYWRHGLQRMFKTEDNKRVSVPIYISLLVIATYILSGALLFTVWEKDAGWDFLIGSYFCFITLTTIGFGDYVPGTSVDTWAAQEKLILCALYVVFGLALITMCFDLMQEEVRNKCRALGQKLGLIAKDKK